MNSWFFQQFLSPVRSTPKPLIHLTLFWVSTALMSLWVIELFRYATYSLETSQQGLFVRIIWWLFLFELLSLWQQWIFKQHDWRLLHALKKTIYSFIFRKYISLDNNYSDTLWTWRLQSVINSWITNWSSFIYTFFLRWSHLFVWAIWSLVLIFLTDIGYWIWALCALLLVYGTFWIRNKKDRELRKIAKEKYVQIDRLLITQIMSKFEILQSDTQDYEEQKYIHATNDLTTFETVKWRYNFLAYRWIFSFFSFVQVFIYLFAWYQVFSWTLDLSWFFVISLSFRLLLWILDDVRDIMRMYSKDFVHIEKIRATFTPEKSQNYSNNWPEFTPNHSWIEIRDLSFWYGDSHVFSWFSTHLPWGKKVALVGESWSWKSTLLKLLSWYLTPSCGNILVDGFDLQTVSKKSYFSHIWYLSQEASIFDWTIRENLLYWIDPATPDLEKRLQLWVTKAKCDFITTSVNWLETEIWERWMRLSWWQRQRLALAKIFIKNPEIILLDEPTSALDSISEDYITQAMEELFRNRTVIIVAHRLQTVKEADLILVMHNSTIVEQWSHQELIEKKGHYAQLIDLQSCF